MKKSIRPPYFPLLFGITLNYGGVARGISNFSPIRVKKPVFLQKRQKTRFFSAAVSRENAVFSGTAAEKKSGFSPDGKNATSQLAKFSGFGPK
jgi:hypothetical protein